MNKYEKLDGFVKPIETCPICKIKVSWNYYDNGINHYSCSSKVCPIKFNEKVQKIYFKRYHDNFDLEGSILIFYDFIIDNFYIETDCLDKTYLIHPLDQLKEPVIAEIFDIDWDNLDLFKSKIKTIITFS